MRSDPTRPEHEGETELPPSHRLLHFSACAGKKALSFVRYGDKHRVRHTRLQTFSSRTGGIGRLRQGGNGPTGEPRPGYFNCQVKVRGAVSPGRWMRSFNAFGTGDSGLNCSTPLR